MCIFQYRSHKITSIHDCLCLKSAYAIADCVLLLPFASILCAWLSFPITFSRKFDVLDSRRLGLRLLMSTCLRIRPSVLSAPVIIGDKLRLGAVLVLIIRPLLGDLATWSLVLRLADFNFTLRSISKETTGPFGPGIVFLLFSWNVHISFFKLVRRERKVLQSCSDSTSSSMKWIPFIFHYRCFK